MAKLYRLLATIDAAQQPAINAALRQRFGRVVAPQFRQELRDQQGRLRRYWMSTTVYEHHLTAVSDLAAAFAGRVTIRVWPSLGGTDSELQRLAPATSGVLHEAKTPSQVLSELNLKR